MNISLLLNKIVIQPQVKSCSFRSQLLSPFHATLQWEQMRAHGSDIDLLILNLLVRCQFEPTQDHPCFLLPEILSLLLICSLQSPYMVCLPQESSNFQYQVAVKQMNADVESFLISCNGRCIWHKASACDFSMKTCDIICLTCFSKEYWSIIMGQSHYQFEVE